MEGLQDVSVGLAASQIGYVRNVSTSWASATTGLVGFTAPSDMIAGVVLFSEHFGNS